MKTSRRAQARVFLHLFYFILLAAIYFFSFLNATSLFEERNRLGSKLDNFFIPSPPDNFLAALLCYEVDLFNNFITERIARALLCFYSPFAIRYRFIRFVFFK